MLKRKTQFPIHSNINCFSKRFIMKLYQSYDIFYPIHLTSRIIGMTSFSIKTSENVFKASISIFDLCFLCLSLWWCLTLSLILKVAPESIFEMLDVKIFTKLFISSILCMFFCFLALITFNNIWFVIICKKFVLIFNQLDEIDSKVSVLIIKHNRNNNLCFHLLSA